MVQSKLISAVSVFGLALLAAACSGDPDQSIAELEDVDAALLPTPEEVYAEHQRKIAGTISEAERRTIENFLASRGIDEDAVRFNGRVVGIDGDTFQYADDLLALAEAPDRVEKGRVFSERDTRSALPGCTSSFPCPVVDVDLAEPSGNSITWKRPDTSITYYLVAPSNASSEFLLDLGLAGSRIAAAQERGGDSVDCLTNTLFEAITIANYNALPLATRQSTYAITFIHQEDGLACFSGSRGCSSGPHLGTVKVNGVTTTRLRFGHVIGFLNTEPNTDEPDGVVNSNVQCNSSGFCSVSAQGRDEAVGIIIHEILHAMGLAHTNSTLLAVPGTQGSGGANQTTSVMVADPQDFNASFRNWSSINETPALDRTMLRKLYQGSCAYTNNTRTVNP